LAEAEAGSRESGTHRAHGARIEHTAGVFRDTRVTIRGAARDQQNLAVPGVAVTATSPVLQGPRTTVTDVQGGYVLRLLPPGEYQVRYELSGFATLTRNAVVPLGLPVEQDVSMRAAGVAESVQVTGDLPAPIATPVVGANYTRDEIEALATPRTIDGIAQLSPGVTQTGPNQGTEGGSVGQVVINGAFANFGKASGNTVTNLNYTGIDTFPRAFSGATAGGRTFRVAMGFRF
jgi:hypothetical protein